MSGLASEDTKNVFGNANMDEIIDEEDIEYVRGVIDGTNEVTELADANYDGEIDEEDIAQIELIIAGEETKLTLIDGAGRAVTVPKPIERVVLIGMLNEVKTLVQLGASDTIVATSTVVTGIYDEPGFSKYFDPLHKAAPELGDLPRIDYSAPNLEQIIALKPDIILSYGTYSDPDEIQMKTDIPTICIGDSTGGDLSLLQHRLIGILMGKEKEVNELSTYLDEKFDELRDVTSEISDDEKPKVLVVHMGGPESTKDIRTVMARYDPVEIAGGINVAEGCFGNPSSVVVSKEQILAWNPDIILLGSYPSKEHPYSVEDVLSDPDLQTLSAVKNESIYYTRGCRIGWDPATVAVEAFYFAKLFHPDKFADLDVEEVGNEILHRFYGVDGLYTEMAEKIGFHTF
jgi:iron complex transport system substrate-binding protein